MTNNVERYVINIDPCRDVSDDAMASMLSSWVAGTIEAQEWLGWDAVQSLMREHVLRLDDVEEMTMKVINALDGSGLYTHLLRSTRNLDIVNCEVNRSIAYIEIQWIQDHEPTDSHTTA